MTAARPSTLHVHCGAAWTVTLDKPRRANALSVDMVDDLHAVLDEAVEDSPLALVIRGNSRHFAGGFDLSGLEYATDSSLAHRFLRIGLLLDRLACAPFLTVAVIEGSAVGAGADLGLACDHRLVGPDATFRFPGSRFGVVLGTARLAALTGDVTLTGGRTVSADHVSGLSTGTPDQLEDLLAGWSTTHPTARAGLLAAARRGTHADADRALADLARSVAVPGLRDRITSYADQALSQERAS